MITTDDAGTALSSIFNSRTAQNYLDIDRAPEDEIVFARKVGTSWLVRDVSALLISSTPIVKGIGREIGVSRGQSVDFTSSNAPIAIVDQNYTSGVTLSVRPQLVNGSLFTPATSDYIIVSDYFHQEVRRISGVGTTNGYLSSFTLSEALDNAYNAEITEVRFFWGLDTTTNRLKKKDWFDGWLTVKTGFVDLPQKTWVYMGQITGADGGETVIISCKDRLQSLVDYELNQRVEFDDRGVASVPVPNPANLSDAIISDVEYLTAKLPDLLTTETWTFSFLATGRIRVNGSVSGNIDADPVTGGHQDWLPSDLEADGGSRSWTIDLLGDYGWSVTIDEVGQPLAVGDNFQMFTRASGVIAVVKGGTHGTNEIDATNLTQLYPSYIIEYVVKHLLGWVHVDPSGGGTGTTTDLIEPASLAAARALPNDFRAELRGFFEKGQHAIDIVDDALKIGAGWLYSTEDDHLRLVYYSPIIVNTLLSLNLSSDESNAARHWNVWASQLSTVAVNEVRNRVKFQFGTGSHRPEIGEVVVENESSVEKFGQLTYTIKAEDRTDVQLATRFDTLESVVHTAASRILARESEQLQSFSLTVHPLAMFLQVGDVVKLYSRDLQRSGVSIWIREIRKSFRSAERSVSVIAEDATHLSGKYAVFADIAGPTPSAIWDVTGFIGTVGQERIGIWADPTLQLDVLGNNNATYNPLLGKPDQNGNHVEDGFIWW